MAEDIHSEGSEEEKKEDSQQDEDFGLPDLEFEELEELDLNIDEAESSDSNDAEDSKSDNQVLSGSDDIDMSVLDDIEVSEETSPEPQSEDLQDVNNDTALDQGIDEIEDVLDSAQLISDRLGEDDDDDMDASDITQSVESTTEEVSEPENIEMDETSISEISSDDLSTESVTGLTDEELEALMTPPEPVPDVDAILSSDETDVDDILASIDSPDDLAALGVTDEAPPEVDTEDTVGSSLFAADDDMSALTTDSSEEFDMSSLDDVDMSIDSEMEATETVSEDLGLDSSDSIFEAGAVEGESIFESDSIALDSASSEKVEFQSPENASLPPNYKPYTYEEATTGNFAKVIVIGVVVISLIGLTLLYFHMQSDEAGKEGNKIAKTEKTHKPAAKKTTTPVASDDQEETTTSEDNSSKALVEKETPVKKVVKKEAPVEKTPVKKTVSKAPVQTASAGQIIPVKEKTGRVYAIIGSFIDEDIAMDYANELSAQGKGVKIIYPYGSSRNYRVTIADYGSIGEATSNIDDIKADYGDQVWALKY